MSVVMVGAGDFADSNSLLFDLDLAQFYDVPREAGETKLGVPVKLDFLRNPSKLQFISCIGDTRQKRELIEGLAILEPLNWINVIAKIVEIHIKTVTMGKGNMIQPWVSLRPYSSIGDHNLICGQVNVGHHTMIGNFCTLAPKVTLCGNITVGNGVFLGAGCTVVPQVKIGHGAFIKAGTVITKDVPPNTVVQGNPGVGVKPRKPLERWL